MWLGYFLLFGNSFSKLQFYLSVQWQFNLKSWKIFLILKHLFLVQCWLFTFFSCQVVSDSLWLPGLQHSRLLCPLFPRVCSNSYPLSQWRYLTISSSATLFSFCPQSFPASGSFPVSRLFASGGQSIGASASASVLPMNIQGWYPLGWTGLISLQVIHNCVCLTWCGVYFEAASKGKRTREWHCRWMLPNTIAQGSCSKNVLKA